MTDYNKRNPSPWKRGYFQDCGHWVNWEYLSEPGVCVCAWSWADCRSGCAQAGNDRVSEMARVHTHSNVYARRNKGMCCFFFRLSIPPG